MTELKSYDLVDIQDYRGEVYLKTEADKVIAELKDKLQNISSLLNQTRECLVESQKLHKKCADNAVKVIRHHKFKRCLDKAELYHWKAGIFIYKKEKNDFYYRWYERWLKIAEKFKEEST